MNLEASIFFLFISLVCIALIGYYTWLDHRYLRLLKLRVKKLYASPLFAELSPILKSVQKRIIEELLVDKTGIVIRFLEPVGSQIYFNTRDRELGTLTPEKQEALVVLLEEFLPKITDSHRYRLRKRRKRLVNGKVETYYQYVILNQYKTLLSRTPRYNSPLRQLRQ